MEKSIEAHYQASLKTTPDPHGGPVPACPSGKSWDEVSGKTGSEKFYHNVISVRSTAPLDCDTRSIPSATVSSWTTSAHGGQLQPHRNNGDLQGLELHC